MKFLSLFDGCHMFGHALRNVGAECVGTSEINKNAAAVTSYHYPQTPALGAVQNVNSTNADLIVAGFPCQDLSVAGDRRGLAGERSGLFWEIIRIARASTPRWILLENVPGLLSSNGGRDMGAVLGALGKLGYGWAYRVLDAQHFGVPQRRRRVFIVGSLGDARRSAEVLFEPESVRGGTVSSRPEDARGCTVRAFNWRGNDAAPNRCAAPCLDTATSGSLAVIGAGPVRRLMPVECERLQGLPDDWTKHGRKPDGATYEQSDPARYKMIGNGGAVPVVEWIGRRIMKQEARV